MTDKDDWLQRKELERSGIDLRLPAVRLHGRNETAAHLCVKALVARAIQRAGREWDTEVVVGDHGRVDVLDLGPPDAQPVAYEIETGVTPAKAKEKADQYTAGPIRDVIVIDPEEAPWPPEQTAIWLRVRYGVGV